MPSLRYLLCRIAASLLVACPAAIAETVSAIYQSASEVPVEATGYVATGKNVSFILNFAPVAGTGLTVVRHSGLPFIQGTFDNLAQGQRVDLTYAGITYRFVANYFGGSGNDLTLQWADTRAFAWGSNNGSALGTGSGTSSLAKPVIATGVLAGKTVVQIAAGDAHSLALCSDGTVASWGYNLHGQLGNSSFYDSFSPVEVKLDGGLSGKTVIAIAAGRYHSLALCSDGSVAAWGCNSSGQLGNGSTLDSSVPVIVSTSGVLAGKTVVAIGAGQIHSLALCSDGTVAGWGSNVSGQLGVGGIGNVQLEPVAAYRGGILAGKTVTALRGGNAHTLALCSDGTLAAWGSNSKGQLGINSVTNQSRPVQVIQTGVLAGKTVVDIGCGNTHSLAVCSDGSMAGWGNNGTNQLASSSTSDKLAPVTVVRSGSLTGKTVIALHGAPGHTLGLSPDGTLSAWGYNFWGQLGNGTTTSSVSPVAVSMVNLRAGERFVAGSANQSGQHCLGLAASLPPPTVLTSDASDASDVHGTGATLNGSVNAAGAIANAMFEYGTTSDYDRSIPATPLSLLAGTSTSAVSAGLTGLLPGTTYHYRLVSSNENGTATGEDRTFTTSVKATLAGLDLSTGNSLSPSFSPATTAYFVTVPHSTGSIVVTPRAADPSALIRLNGAAPLPGGSSDPLPLSPGDNSIAMEVESADGLERLSYSLTVHRLPETLRFESELGNVARSGGFSLDGISADLELGFPPPTGRALTVLENSGLNPILGEFQNLPQGQLVLLEQGDTRYAYVANYHGGSGNDLVLEWAHQRLMSWGSGDMGQLGNNSSARRLFPVPVSMSGALAGKTITSAALGEHHNLVLCSDGSLVAWGLNDYGQLGFDGGSTYFSGLPVAVVPSGALVGKRVVAIQAGGYHSLALCSDGTLLTWGLGIYGQLGNGANLSSPVPVAVPLAGKRVVAIAAAFDSNLALCSDGSLVSWGSNQHGQLGDNDPGNRNKPVNVPLTGALTGKSVVSIHAGAYHYLALCSDGSLAAWGYNNSNQLGNNSTVRSPVPVSVDLSSGLAGKTLRSVAPLGYGNLALCTDGSLAGWGENYSGQLGPTPDFFVPAPRLIAPAGALLGKTVTRLGDGGGHGLAHCTDGSLAAWGYNGDGVLGNNTTVSSNIPVTVSTASLHPGERFTAAFATSFHNLALTGLPPPVAVTSAATLITGSNARLNGLVNAQGRATAVWFELGLDTNYGIKVPAGPSTVSAVGNSSVSAMVAGLSPGTIYHYRVVADGDRGGNNGPDMTFMTSRPPEFAGYTISTPFQTPATISSRRLLGKASDPDDDPVSLTAAGPASVHGGTATLQASGILYTPPAGFSGTDSFSVTFSDSRGTTATGLVTAIVGPGPDSGGIGSNPPALTPLPGGAIAILFHGIPGRSYRIQRSTDMSLWTTLATVTADPKGLVDFTDPAPPRPSAFYRISEP